MRAKYFVSLKIELLTNLEKKRVLVKNYERPKSAIQLNEIAATISRRKGSGLK